MASHVAASAFGHCRTMVRDDEVATRLAIVAAHRGGRALATVLGHARHQSLDHLGRHPPPPVVITPGSGPADVAWALATTRPALELAVVDLSGRHGLSRAGLGIALRLSPSAAAERVAAIGQTWDAELDPALLAWLGPGECDELAAVLDERSRDGAAELLELCGEVGAHTATCAMCADRQRAMASVRLLVVGAPLPPPPPTVVAAVSGSRLQPPIPPPALERHRDRLGLPAIAVVVAALVVAGMVMIVVRDRADERVREASLQALTRLPLTAGSLQLVPATLGLPLGQVTLTNGSGAAVGWQATTDAPWLDVTPERGRLEPGGMQSLRLRGSPPEGEVRASLKVSGDDGSAAAAALAGTVERPPDLGASADGCRVTATAEDEGDVVVTLHWRSDDAERSTVMVRDDKGDVADLPMRAGPLTWWVSAVDGRGNQARTPDVALPAGC